MSGKIMGAVYELALTSAQREVLLALADHADDAGGSVRPSHARIAWKLDCSERSVRRNVDELLRAGILIQVRRSTRGRNGEPGRPNEYRIDLSAGVRKHPFRELADESADTTMAAEYDESADTAMAGEYDESAAISRESPAKIDESAAISRESPATAVSTQPSVKSSSSEPSIKPSSGDDLFLTVTWLASAYQVTANGRKLSAAQLAELALLVGRIPAGYQREWCEKALQTMAGQELDSPFGWLRRVLSNALAAGKPPGSNGNGAHTAPALNDAAALRAYYTPAGYEGIIES